MADWTDIPDENLSPNAPARSADMLAMRDNITAQAEGAAGAPKTQAAALEETTGERDWVNGRIATSSAGAVGTYALLRRVGTFNAIGAGATVGGSSLRYSGAGGRVTTSTPSGTWRCMGLCGSSEDSAANQTTLWLRIS